MMRIGNFAFPPQRTTVQATTIEAKSKVRKEIRLRALLIDDLSDVHAERIAQLRAEIERFDRDQAAFSQHPGRYYTGRQRRVLIHSHPRKPLTWVDLTLLTHDRFERSQALHQTGGETDEGARTLHVWNRGNWPSPFTLILEAHSEIESLNAALGDETFTFGQAMQAGQTLVLDTEEPSVWLDQANAFAGGNQVFPQLAPGENSVEITLAPATAQAQCTLQFRDFWI